jgi:general secretion pathway protein G
MNKKGFTLIELLIVVAIIGIIAAIAIPNLLVALQKGKQKATMGDMKSIGTAVMSYAVDYSFVPQGAEGPISVLHADYFEPFYIKVLPTSDAWGGEVQYQRGDANTANQDLYSIHSWGRDGADTAIPAIPLYDTTTLSDFNNDIYFADIFTLGPRVKR